MVIIVDPANFAKFQNSQPSTRTYDSGQVVTSSLDVPVAPGGTYYLVFANKFDASNAKTLDVQVDLVSAA